jgi:hypothetical protein
VLGVRKSGGAGNSKVGKVAVADFRVVRLGGAIEDVPTLGPSVVDEVL